MNTLSACSFRWFTVESTVRWFIVREKHCWIAADSADKSKRTGCIILALLLFFLIHMHVYILCYKYFLTKIIGIELTLNNARPVHV
jgi:hypothetical protein